MAAGVARRKEGAVWHRSSHDPEGDRSTLESGNVERAAEVSIAQRNEDFERRKRLRELPDSEIKQVLEDFVLAHKTKGEAMKIGQSEVDQVREALMSDSKLANLLKTFFGASSVSGDSGVMHHMRMAQKLIERLLRAMAMPRGGQRVGDGMSDLVAASASSFMVQGRRRVPRNSDGWQCSLLNRRIGRVMPAPIWYNNPACGAVGRNGTQRNLECGLFAVNHCLASKRDMCLHIDQFKERAGTGAYPEGDFDDEGLQRNLKAVGCHFYCMRGGDYQYAVRDLFDNGSLAIFNGQHALGCVVHMPVPRHWIALVAPTFHFMLVCG